jgi:predicted transposase/invertase (TIGR01784 family)
LERKKTGAFALAEGEAKKAAETARNMKTKGFSVKDIADITGLSVEEIENFRTE